MSHVKRNHWHRYALSSGVLAAAALLGCDGENLFSPTGSLRDGGAPGVEIQSPQEPAARPIGDSVLITAHVFDDVGVDSVYFAGISFRGDPDLGTDSLVLRYEPKMVRFPASAPDTTVSRYLVATPDTVRETAVLFAVAYDSRGNTAADSVAVLVGGPRVQFLTIEDNQRIQSGLSLNLQVEASDPEGILDVSIDVTGAFETSIDIPVDPPRDTVLVDTAVVIPSGITGTIEVTATARSGLNVTGSDGPITLQIVTTNVQDQVPPTLVVSTVSNERLELEDSITLVVSGSDDAQGSGVARVGYTVKAISPSRGDTLVRTAQQTFSPPRTGNLAQTFTFSPFNVDPLSLPDTLVFEITGWMYDGDGNCSAAVSDLAPQSYGCFGLPGGEIVAESRPGIRQTRVMVAGRTIQLPSGGQVMDAAVDSVRKRLLLSNIERNRVEVFNLSAERFEQAIGVGSEPWGLTVDRSGDNLLVANSGGTNISVVDLVLGREVESQRFFAPDAVIFDLELREGDSGFSFIVTPFPQPTSPSFSDRPQYIAVDSFGSIVYSTKTTSVGDIGTARKAYFPSGGDRSEVKLFVEHGANSLAEDFWAIAHIDSIGVGVDTISIDTTGIVFAVAGVTLFDHVPGFPDQVISATSNTGTLDPVENAWANLVNQGSDAYVDAGARWNIPGFGFADTTFVTASGDGGWVLIGEGGTSPTGRVMMYRAAQADTTDLSATLRVWDEVINAADNVRGVGLNHDGTLGVARGTSAYFFDTELQLNGRVELPVSGAGAGAALHPLHANQKTLENLDGEYRPDTHLAFVGTGNGTIDIIDTFKFIRIGEITLRDVITGPLRAVLPFPGENAGMSCPTIPVQDQLGRPIGEAIQLYQGGDFTLPIPINGTTDEQCVVMKLFATTSAEGVVVVPVKKADVFKKHPNREGF